MRFSDTARIDLLMWMVLVAVHEKSAGGRGYSSDLRKPLQSVMHQCRTQSCGLRCARALRSSWMIVVFDMLDRDACAASWSGGCQLSLLARLAVAFYLPRSSMLKYISSSVIYVVAIVVIRFLAFRESFSMQASIAKAQSRSDLYPRQYVNSVMDNSLIACQQCATARVRCNKGPVSIVTINLANSQGLTSHHEM
ncbi:hypothetical protein EJ05DRAFT_321651 [Pseudovirgaria hyperparasitica]|uniref:Uncharacterized protein n=1 Tax=Pseudovirgaria hyperparasitica TaxID=470096 RepID=A0A6A6VT79_9PEZI|nr:uncharacterized protein EJ05DRAFT_321651 [Pseudovirgaria hyperparasitica]KAF2752481.1 hypothetical protein EJ05DRAFT_321651 [Pseudovirgaria hyperparasitica]